MNEERLRCPTVTELNTKPVKGGSYTALAAAAARKHAAAESESAQGNLLASFLSRRSRTQ